MTIQQYIQKVVKPVGAVAVANRTPYSTANQETSNQTITYFFR